MINIHGRRRQKTQDRIAIVMGIFAGSPVVMQSLDGRDTKRISIHKLRRSLAAHEPGGVFKQSQMLRLAKAIIQDHEDNGWRQGKFVMDKLSGSRYLMYIEPKLTEAKRS